MKRALFTALALAMTACGTIQQAMASQYGITRCSAKYEAQLLVQHPEWAPEIRKAVSCHEVEIGMTSVQVTDALGSPDKVNTTTTSDDTSEQWVYHSQYVYLDNGTVTATQSAP